MKKFLRILCFPANGVEFSFAVERISAAFMELLLRALLDFEESLKKLAKKREFAEIKSCCK